MTSRLSADKSVLPWLSFVEIPSHRPRISSANPILCITPRMRRSFAFTLVELLVVMAVLGTLAALTFPALNAAKSASKNAACVSNLKQIGAALFSYVADHDGALVPGSSINDSKSPTYTWFQVLNEEYMGGNPKNRYSTNPPSWQECPSKRFKSKTTYQNIGYGWNWFAGSYTNGVADGGFGYMPDWPGYGYNSRLSQVTHPAKTIIVGDSKDLENIPTGSDYMNMALYPPPAGGSVTWADPKNRASRHGGKGNYLMVDGHVEALPPTMDASYFKKIK